MASAMLVLFWVNSSRLCISLASRTELEGGGHLILFADWTPRGLSSGNAQFWVTLGNQRVKK